MIDDALIEKITTLSHPYKAIRSASEGLRRDILKGEDLSVWAFLLKPIRGREAGKGDMLAYFMDRNSYDIAGYTEFNPSFRNDEAEQN